MKVLIAVDGSSYAAEAAEFVLKLPCKTPPSVTLLMVVNPPEVALSGSTEMWYPQYIEHQQEYAEQAIDQIANRFEGRGWQIDRHVAHGHIGHTIVDYGEQIDADLTVVGARGHTAIGRILLGSISDYVATHAGCSVVVIRPKPDNGDPFPRKISIAYDGTPPAQTALDEFSRFDWSPEEPIQVITASPKLEVFREDVLASLMEEGARRRTEALRTAKSGGEQLASHGWNVTHQSIETEHIGEGLLEAADAFGSELMVIGDAGRGALTRLLLGSTSRYVLRHAKQSVWIVRHHESDEEE